MLQIRHIRKEYRTGNLVQKALDDVSLNLRDNEFVAILGPSGSGKTTLLNIIGGLDRYDSGDLIINGISTKKYRDRDWDSYRNHTIGFVFQSYNLIPHQTVLANVELALTISGIDRGERRKRAQEALEKVGLGSQIHKKPNQMSGGQMQRVAIARALVNDPDILLADEPTGALDSDTSVQVMELLKEVAKDRLVVMVTHNPELAEEYATRIVKLKDGKIRSDSDRYEIDENTMEEPEHRNMGKASMSFLTALSLSFNNLKTKKARTLLTSFAGSIGIIGIALILSLSSGVNAYIQTIEEETLSEYPLQIQSTGVDMSSMLTGGEAASEESTSPEKNEENDVHVIQMMTNMFSTMDSNDLESLKKYLDSGESGIEKYSNAVEYSYTVSPQIYKLNGDVVRQVHPDQSFDALGLGSSSSINSMMSSMMSTNVFHEMPENESLYENQYDVKAGRWPEKYNECVVILTSGGGMSDFMLYTLGLRDPLELDEMIQQFINEESVDTPADIGDYSYEDILGTKFKLISSSDYYVYDSQYKVWKDKTDDEQYMKDIVENGEDITVVGIVAPSEDANGAALTPGIGYPAALTRHSAEKAEKSEIVRQQLAEPNINVFTGEAFGEESNGNGLDSESLISVDEAKLQQAFGLDESALSEGLSGIDLAQVFTTEGKKMDMSGMIDLSGISVEIPDMPQIDMKELLGSLDVSVSSEGLSSAAVSIMEGYREYAADHPEADYSGIQQDFMDFLRTEEAKQIIADNIRDIIQASGIGNVTQDQMKEMIRDIMAGYAEYAASKGYTDPERFGEYLMEYLGTDQASSVMNKWAEELLGGSSDIQITAEQLTKLASDLADGYQDYARQNGLPDPGKMGEYFADYLATPDGQKRLEEGLAGMVDMGSLQEQIATPIKIYMEEAMTSYGSVLSSELEKQITLVMQQIMSQLADGMSSVMSQAMASVGSSLKAAMNIDTDAFTEAFQMNMDGEALTELMMSMSSARNATYENNLSKMGYIDFNQPSQISIYPKDFESKENVVSILNEYNARMEAEGKDEQVITYTDIVGTMMSSVTDIIDVISYVLIAFVAISLVVSSIMIGVITYISVLERKKEIGILRAIGASKGNISQVFNAETVIIGLCAGLIGIGITLLLLIPANALIHHLAGTSDISAFLPVIPGIILILLSVLLTLLGGLIPSKKAAKSDPVTALRTE